MELINFFKDLLQYNHHYNVALIDTMLAQTQELPAKSVNLMNHILNAHEIWNARVLKAPVHCAVWEIRDLETLKDINDRNYHHTLSILEKENLDTVIHYRNSKGTAYSGSVRDILFHVINHSNYHRAQIATDFKIHGIAPLSTDYIFYKRS